jgi:hypothetical protein
LCRSRNSGSRKLQVSMRIFIVVKHKSEMSHLWLMTKDGTTIPRESLLTHSLFLLIHKDDGDLIAAEHTVHRIASLRVLHPLLVD